MFILTAPACSDCGSVRLPGPLGVQCPRCMLSLAAAAPYEDTERATDLFPELEQVEYVAGGGFGAVFRAEHRRMKRAVALKFLDPLHARSAEAVTQFEREMQAAGKLDHPGIVRAYDAGERDGQWYLMMEFVDGVECAGLVRRHGVLPLAESCEIIRQAALALEHAHEQGLVHRDVKPGNLMVARGPAGVCVKVLDFGLASFTAAPLYPTAGEDGDDLPHFLGSLEYTAPEQIENPATVDGRADLYSLGATLRRFLTGSTPHPGGGSEHSFYQHLKLITSGPPSPIASVRADLPPGLSALCDRLLATDPRGRPATAAELALLLAPWTAGADLPRLFQEGPLQESRPVPLRRSSRLFYAAAILAGLAAGTVIWQRHVMPESSTPPAAAVQTWTPLFSQEIIQLRQLDENTTPRLFDKLWERETTITSADPMRSARATADGRFVFIHGESKIAVQRPGENPVFLHNAKEGIKLYFLGVAPDTGDLIWGHEKDNAGFHLRRASADGTLLPPLRYDFAAEYPPFPYESSRQALVELGKSVADGYPWGFACLAADQFPPGLGLRAGDVLVADEGHRSFLPSCESKPGLWRCRFDNDAPASRLGSLPIGKSGGLSNYPVDVAVSRNGVFLLNRSEPIPGLAEENILNFTDRLLRWDLDGFHSCTLDEPLQDPSGLAADPLSGDLYAIQGALIPSASIAVQRLLRLCPDGPDRYRVEIAADRFGKLGTGGLAFSPDGQQLIITDVGNRAIVVLRRVSPQIRTPQGDSNKNPVTKDSKR